MPKTTEEEWDCKCGCGCGCHITEGNPLDICQHCDYSNRWFSQEEVDEKLHVLNEHWLKQGIDYEKRLEQLKKELKEQFGDDLILVEEDIDSVFAKFEVNL